MAMAQKYFQKGIFKIVFLYFKNFFEVLLFSRNSF